MSRNCDDKTHTDAILFSLFFYDSSSHRKPKQKRKKRKRTGTGQTQNDLRNAAVYRRRRWISMTVGWGWGWGWGRGEERRRRRRQRVGKATPHDVIYRHVLQTEPTNHPPIGLFLTLRLICLFSYDELETFTRLLLAGHGLCVCVRDFYRIFFLDCAVCFFFLFGCTSWTKTDSIVGLVWLRLFLVITGFSSVLLGFTGFYWVFLSFYRFYRKGSVLRGFCIDLIDFHRLGLGLLGFTGFY